MSEKKPLTEVIVSRDVEDIHALTEAGREYIEPLVTNIDGDVLAWTEKADKHKVATQNMRKSRSPNFGPVIYTREFSGDEDKDLEVGFRISQKFGDESVEQLFSVDMDITGLSQLATKQVEWHRIGVAYLERSTRYVDYDEKLPEYVPIDEDDIDYSEKDKTNEYRYVTPSTVTGNERLVYRAMTDGLFDNYSHAVGRIIDYVRSTTPKEPGVPDYIYNSTTRAKALDAARALLPASARTTLGFHATAQAINHMVLRLQSSDIPEATVLGDKILTEARKVSPVFFERTAWDHRGGETVRFLKAQRESIQNCTDRYLPPKSAEKIGGQIVSLVNYYPKDEFDLLPYMLYEEADSGYSLEDIKEELSKLTHQQKLRIMREYMGQPTNRRHKPGRAVERAVYDWDLVSDFGAFRDLQRHRLVSDLKWQRLTTEHGFDIPPLMHEVGLDRLCKKSIRLSESLYEMLAEAGQSIEAQYAVLLGHRIRWTWQTNGRANNHILQLRSTPAGHPSYRKTVQSMFNELEKVHPHLARLSLPFMNMDEDPALGRLDQELALHHKQQLKRD